MTKPSLIGGVTLGACTLVVALCTPSSAAIVLYNNLGPGGTSQLGLSGGGNSAIDPTVQFIAKEGGYTRLNGGARPPGNGVPTGTGVFDPFVRIQRKGNEHGYNTDATAPLDAKGGIWTRSILLGDFRIVNIAGVDYREFLLDVDEPTAGLKHYLTLNQIQIFVGPDDPELDFTVSPAVGDDPKTKLVNESANPIIAFGPDTGMDEVFRLNGAKSFTNRIELDYALEGSGNGRSDMFFYVEQSAFASYSNSDNLVLYSHFGKPPGTYDSESGFEEWGDGVGGDYVPPPPDPSTTPVPEPTTLAIWGIGLISSAFIGRSRLAPTQKGCCR